MSKKAKLGASRSISIADALLEIMKDEKIRDAKQCKKDISLVYGRAKRGTISAALSRLMYAGQLQRVGFGKYCINGSAVK